MRQCDIPHRGARGGRETRCVNLTTLREVCGLEHRAGVAYDAVQVFREGVKGCVCVGEGNGSHQAGIGDRIF